MRNITRLLLQEDNEKRVAAIAGICEALVDTQDDRETSAMEATTALYTINEYTPVNMDLAKDILRSTMSANASQNEVVPRGATYHCMKLESMIPYTQSILDNSRVYIEAMHITRDMIEAGKLKGDN